jgi:drug/metabolite transporter (DMT)-like permease
MTMAMSLKYLTASMSGVLIYLAIPFSYVLDFLFFGTLISRIEIIGASLIVGVNVVLGILKGQGVVH